MSKREIAAGLISKSKEQLFERDMNWQRRFDVTPVQNVSLGQNVSINNTLSTEVREALEALTRPVSGEDYLEKERTPDEILKQLRTFALFLMSVETRDIVVYLEKTERTFGDAINNSIGIFSAIEEKKEDEKKKTQGDIDLR